MKLLQLPQLKEMKSHLHYVSYYLSPFQIAIVHFHLFQLLDRKFLICSLFLTSFTAFSIMFLVFLISFHFLIGRATPVQLVLSTIEYQLALLFITQAVSSLFDFIKSSKKNLLDWETFFNRFRVFCCFFTCFVLL